MTNPQRLRLVPRVKVWFETEDGYGFGSGLVAILLAVETVGSLKGAAKALGRSYRHVWDRVKEAEQALGTTLVETQVGGTGTRRSVLSDAGRQVVDEFVALRERMTDAMDRESSKRSTES